MAQRPETSQDRELPLARPTPHLGQLLAPTLFTLQEMRGRKSAEMVQRYAQLAPARMARNASVIDLLLHLTTTSLRRQTLLHSAPWIMPHFGRQRIGFPSAAALVFLIFMLSSA
ncbi:hypothetical protein ASF77_21800 [Massilia sp. Leaf139]|nr:hypothetical protein ASF77_21800 [Massilia sp. Leaf139]